MKDHLEKLISIGSEPVCTAKRFQLFVGPDTIESRVAELDWLLDKKNGFYAFEKALHVFPSQCDTLVMTLERWNTHSTWKSGFSIDLADILFFAEDIFANQFGICDEKIVRFNPETAEMESHSETLDNWASTILNDYDYETGYSIAHSWQESYGLIPDGQRLFPKIPFVLGGQFDHTNLYLMDEVKGMHFLAELSNQISELPDGTEVQLKVSD